MALKILLADDSMTAQNMGKKILLDAGYEVIAVSNGAAAIKKIASDRPDIIIVDEYMPGYTGSEVCERVKGSPDTSRTPVLLTVGKMEPFSPEKANKVRADGVLIKPFEATDLIAVIQSIANKMTASAPPRVDPTVRIAPPMASLDQTILISPPPHDDTVRVPAPRTTHAHPAYEETLRLTPEQIRAFQDKSYKDWVASAEVEEEEKPVTQEAPEMAVSAPDTEEPIPLEPVMAPAPSILEPMQSPVFEEPEPATPIMPGLDSTESHMARAMAGTMAGHDFFTVTSPNQAEAPADAEAAEAPAMYSGADETFSEAPAQPFFTLSQQSSHERVEIAPDVLSAIAAETEAPVVVEPETVTHELETSAPVEPGPSFVTQLEELEPTIAPPLEVVAAVAPELEINSPIHLRNEVEVTTDPALVTSDDDMSQFVTKFGQEGAEEVHVGMVADLPPEQLAALTSPILEAEEPEVMQEVPELETPDFVVPRMVELQAPEPVISDAVILTEESEAQVSAPPTTVLDEVGAIEPDAAIAGSGPMVAYVPGIEDTQPIPAYIESESTSEPGAISEPEPIVAAGPELVSTVSAEQLQEAASTTEIEAHASSVTMVEAAAAVVGGGAILSEASNFLTVAEPVPAVEEPAAAESFAPAFEETPVEAQEEISAEQSVPAEPEMPEPIGDAALAEELAAALAEKEAEESAMGLEIAEPEAVAAFDLGGEEELHTATDSKLSEAVARALEKLRPQIIAEILKEFTK